MKPDWEAVAGRVVDSLGVEPGHVVEVRDHTGRADVLLEMTLAVEQRGATPRVDFLPADLIQRLLQSTDPLLLASWDEHRARWMEETDRILVLTGDEAELGADDNARLAWSEAAGRIGEIEEDRKLPYLLVAIPTHSRATFLGTTLEELEETVLPALMVSPEELRANISRVLEVVESSETLTLITGDHQLELNISGRKWLQDAGEFPDGNSNDIQPVMNFPAGSVYTTAVESSATGSLLIPAAGGAVNSLLHFIDGRVSSIEAESGADELNAMFDRNTGEPRRISHLGVGLNPYLNQSIGWSLVDEHVHGAVFVAFGENRYLGGDNESSLNVDFVIPDASLLADGRPVVAGGTCAV